MQRCAGKKQLFSEDKLPSVMERNLWVRRPPTVQTARINSVVPQKTRPGNKEDVEITMNSSIPHPQKKTEPSDEREHGNGAERTNTKDSSPEEQTESLLQN